jgi:hypothetical protein
MIAHCSRFIANPFNSPESFFSRLQVQPSHSFKMQFKSVFFSLCLASAVMAAPVHQSRDLVGDLTGGLGEFIPTSVTGSGNEGNGNGETEAHVD